MPDQIRRDRGKGAAGRRATGLRLSIAAHFTFCGAENDSFESWRFSVRAADFEAGSGSTERETS